MFDDLEAAVRAWSVADAEVGEEDAGGEADEKDESADGEVHRPVPSPWTLVFDTETTVDVAQRLRVIAYEVYYEDDLEEAGLAYDRHAISGDEFATLREFAAAHGLVVRTHERSIDDVLIGILVRARGLVVGHNLPFDFSRIANGHGRIGGGDRAMHNGVSFAFPGTDKRLQVKRINARSSFMRLAVTAGSSPDARRRRKGRKAAEHRGFIVDTATVGGAFFGRRLTLKRLAELLGTQHRKTEADLAGPITPELLAYAMNDVTVTRECFVALRDIYAGFGLDGTPLWHIFSEASLGKAYLREMGLRPWRDIQPDFPDDILAAILETYYGGRVECRVRGVPVPGVLVDFVSQYPTVSSLMGMVRYHVATGVSHRDEDPAAVQAMLERVTVDDVLEPRFWAGLHAIVLVDPVGARLPTRASFSRALPASLRVRRALTRTRNVAIADHRGHRPEWWALADAVASVLECGRAPRILRVLRFDPIGIQPGLRPIDVAGDPDYRVDPNTDDFIRRFVEYRASCKRQAKRLRSAGLDAEADTLDARSDATKKSANSIAYGIPIEVNVTDYAKAVGVTVHLPDASSYRPTNVRRHEEPGRWFHPLVATLVVAGGRLLLAAAIRLVRDAGGTYAFNDTDSLFIVATEHGGPVEPRGVSKARGVAPIASLPRTVVRAIVDRFEALNPYDRAAIPGSILEIEDVIYDPDTGAERELWCFSIAAKRYALYTVGADGRPAIAATPKHRYRSEHGLGHLLSPLGRDPMLAWVDRWWEHLLCQELGMADPRPAWFDEPAVGALTLTSAQDERTFRHYNADRPYPEQVRPWGFVMIAHVHTLARHGTGPRVLVAPREDEPTKRRGAQWFDREDPTGRQLAIRTGGGSFIVPGVVAVQSYADYFEEFRRHPEAKAVGPDGRQCRPATLGELSAPGVEVTRLVRIGKEVARLASDPNATESIDSVAQEYRGSTCAGCGKPIAADRRWCSEACRKRTERRVARIPRQCAACARPLVEGQRRWCSEACRKRIGRHPAEMPSLKATGERLRAR